ncbi:MAG: PepSY-associated TM helix domain-containing protein [Candidatus Andeanibacterium colombiense]|uniref:PepSY-associated TM helix domain-containing protein n=1 Tax=Candidatus Andeanibacterium colombiense TaxID=3121345 RepID=A0AAJ5X524_9SPHN|nr:MAG: PepSY-associated TM helix domain-containing protein [Sphingomonadaceae bacterium]
MTLRPFFGFLHRWVGLLIAGFLFISGVTGAVISWDHELDEVLNPHLVEAHSKGMPRSPLELAKEVEARDPSVEVTFIPLAAEPGHSLALGVSGKVDPKTGEYVEPSYNQVFLDPVTGEELGRRNWGAVWPITTETFISFLYVLHYSLHIPTMWGIDHWGLWLMGGIALLWTIDCFVGFYLTLPSRKNGAKLPKNAPKKSFMERWKPAWKIKTSGTRYRINFDIHRAFGLWLWGMLFTIAFTAFSLNLYSEVFYPVMSKVSQVTPGPFDLREERPLNKPIAAKLSYAEVIGRAEREAEARGWKDPAGGAFYEPHYGIYGVTFHTPEGEDGTAGMGTPYLYYDGVTGEFLGTYEPFVGTAADIFVQAQFPLHSGRILGIPGRILMSLMGLVVATLSVTGVVIWLKKRNARRHRKTREGGAFGSGSVAVPAE